VLLDEETNVTAVGVMWKNWRFLVSALDPHFRSLIRKTLTVCCKDLDENLALCWFRDWPLTQDEWLPGLLDEDCLLHSKVAL
jgi:hypothetical protein